MDLAHHHDLAEGRGQGLDGGIELFRRLLVRQQALGRLRRLGMEGDHGRPVLGLDRGIVLGEDQLARPVGGKPGEAGPPDDGQQPGPGLGPSESGEKSEGLHQRLLDDVLGIGGAARQPPREVVGLVQMGHHRLREIRLVDHRPLLPTLPIDRRSFGFIPGRGKDLFSRTPFFFCRPAE